MMQWLRWETIINGNKNRIEWTINSQKVVPLDFIGRMGRGSFL